MGSQISKLTALAEKAEKAATAGLRRDKRIEREAKEEGEFFDEESGELLTGADARAAALDECRSSAEELHSVLQPKFTSEAVQFLAEKAKVTRA